MNVCKELFLNSLNIMKAILDLGEFKFGKDTSEFKFFKKETMNIVYGNLQDAFKKLETDNKVERCSCGANLRRGYTDCKMCYGSGYRTPEKG